MSGAFHFAWAYRDGAWERDVRVRVDAAGAILAWEAGTPAQAGDARHAGYLIPGFRNAHSHAFQYAMAGCAERIDPARPHDDFWSWRSAMYDLALRIDPEGMEAVAACLYAEMLRHGYTHVAEFHYLHHDPQGRPYADRAEMARRLMAAATSAGIDLCLVPVYYRTASFGKAALPEQRRFLFADPDAYRDMLADVQAHAARLGPRIRVGHGLHSLRASPPEDAKALLSPDVSEGPIHIHVAEQTKEVDDCLAAWGKRPVAWLLENVPLGARHVLVHATHMDDAETRGVAGAGACVAICPSTEGNLGDGFFATAAYREAGGTWAIGSDSHVGLSPTEELRWLDYQVRLRERRRNPLARAEEPRSASYLVDMAHRGGCAALGESSRNMWAPGSPLSGLVLDPAFPAFLGKSPDQVLAAFVFATADPAAIATVLSRGAAVVTQGRHRNGASLRKAYGSTVTALRHGAS